eukprot:CAMPEP_0197590430 /NCGR_PEP_ID=MMETSP1326-20131121/11027_1 /TAXON_ID=1155430 /ORGANISM="Genus nov. species nov., Strain RCC2288" /LENGTH=572 /DNA_ID=CAMNT_0043155459 /DNA_START=92 /DNA_END=1810 /DNA_ORIENTATION=+
MVAPALRAALLLLVAAACMSVTAAANTTWVRAITYLDVACTLPQRQSYYEIGKCFNKGPPLRTAEAEVSVRFNADKTLDTYPNRTCTGTATRVNLAALDTCVGGYVVRDWSIGVQSIPSAAIQLTIAYPNTNNVSQCNGDIRYDVTMSMAPASQTIPLVTDECYSDVRIAPTGAANAGQYNQLTYQFLCIGDRKMAYTSYPRNGTVRDCEVPYTAKFSDLAAKFACAPQTGSDPARYSVGCGTLKELLVANNISTGPFMHDTPWGWDFPPPPGLPSPPPPPSPAPPPSMPSPPPEYIVGPTITDYTTMYVGIAVGVFFAIVLCCFCGVLYRRYKNRQRISAVSIKQLQQMFSRMDNDNSGTVDTAEFTAGFHMPNDLYTARLLKMLDSDDNGYITFPEMISGIARFHGCVTTHDFAFRLLDATQAGTVRKDDLTLVLRSVIGDVIKERAGRKASEQYNTKQIMEFMKDMKPELTIEDFEEVEMQFPGVFGGVAFIWEQFEDVVEPCARIVANGELQGLEDMGVDSALAGEDTLSGGYNLKGVVAGGEGGSKDVEQGGGALPGDPDDSEEEAK